MLALLPSLCFSCRQNFEAIGLYVDPTPNSSFALRVGGLRVAKLSWLPGRPSALAERHLRVPRLWTIDVGDGGNPSAPNQTSADHMVLAGAFDCDPLKWNLGPAAGEPDRREGRHRLAAAAQIPCGDDPSRAAAGPVPRGHAAVVGRKRGLTASTWGSPKLPATGVTRLRYLSYRGQNCGIGDGVLLIAELISGLVAGPVGWLPENPDLRNRSPPPCTHCRV